MLKVSTEPRVDFIKTDWKLKSVYTRVYELGQSFLIGYPFIIYYILEFDIMGHFSPPFERYWKNKDQLWFIFIFVRYWSTSSYDKLSQVLLSNFSRISEISHIALMRESMSHFTTPPFPSVEAFEMGQFELRQIKEIISQWSVNR